MYNDDIQLTEEDAIQFNNVNDDTAFVINLSKRPDRWYDINNDMGHLLDLRRINAVLKSPGWHGCYLSHIKIISEAARRNMNTVLILEDDCIVKDMDNFSITWANIKTWLDAHLDQWNIFVGGNTSNIFMNNIQIERVLNDELKIIQLNDTLCAHFIYYNSSCFSQLINQPMNNPIDCFPSNFKKITCLPYIAVQKPGMSDIINASTSYLDIFNNSEKGLYQLLNNRRI
jgi:hypothetical protein